MSKRSQNLENLKKQEREIRDKILKLRIQLSGIEKSITKLERRNSIQDTDTISRSQEFRR